MPELPEVETITNALKKSILGLSFVKIETYFPRLRYELKVHQEPKLLNSNVISVRRRARYTIVELENQFAITFHYGMTGAVRICAPSEERKKHEHVIFHLSDGQQLRFEDPRRFGHIEHSKLSARGAEPDEFKKLGPEPLTKEFNANHLFEAFKNKKTAIKIAIMDNKTVVGVGNIYANESLFSSGISPLTPANEVSKYRLKRFVDNIKTTLEKAITAGGTTIADFKGVDGQEGKFAQELQVYGREGESCVTCKTEVQKIKQGGRSTFYCPKCQK